MKLTSQTIACGASPSDLRRQATRVEPFERAHARVGGEPGVELAVPDVDGDHAFRPAPEQHVGEAAGRGADVEAGEARGIEPEGVERGGELDAAARDIRVGRLGFDRRVRPIGVRGLAQGSPSTRTRPAAMAACARARLGKKPRSTRTMSARLRMPPRSAPSRSARPSAAPISTAPVRRLRAPPNRATSLRA